MLKYSKLEVNLSYATVHTMYGVFEQTALKGTREDEENSIKISVAVRALHAVSRRHQDSDNLAM